MNRIRFIFIAGLLAVVGTALAFESQTWNLRGTMPQGFEARNLTTVQMTTEGLYVQTDTDGFLLLPSLTKRADSLRLIVTSATHAEIAVIWRTPELQSDQYYQQNITLPVGQSQPAIAALHLTDGWEWSAPFLGIAFPANTEVLIEEIEFRSYSFPEKLFNGFLSFWQTDQFRLYSINFLWGPLIGSTQEARDILYETLPPRSWSAARIFYAVFAIALVIGLIMRFADTIKGKRTMLLILACTGAALWILFDIRMTQEILAYVRDDWQFVLGEKGDRTFRSHVTLYDVLDESKKLLGNEERYVLVATPNTPFYSNARYAFYPSVPVLEDGETDGIRSWIILGRPDVFVRDDKLVTALGSTLAESGSILKQFDSSSFFFITK